MNELSDLLAVARGEARAQLVLRNARMVNVFSGEVESGEIAIFGGKIAGIGAGYRGEREVDLKGALVSPGWIDAHVHIESSLCVPPQFAAAVVPRGVTCVVTDPHEIANVAGLAGIRFMAEASRGLPLGVVVMAPSCVPATPMSGSGAALGAVDLSALLQERIAHGLAEVMNFPGVIGGDREVLEKLGAFWGRAIDGHAPATSGMALNAYVAAGVGSDHECVTVAEAREKLARGLYVLIREATNARNLAALLPLITEKNARRICLCTDDRQPADLLGEGSIDHMLREVIASGVDPITAIRLCTLNPAEWFGLGDRGAIAPGRRADLVVFDDLRKPAARQVYVGGERVAESGKLLSAPLPGVAVTSEAIGNSCRVNLDAVDLRISARGRKVRVIGSQADQLVTEHRVEAAKIQNGEAVADVSRDLLKMAVINRHGKTDVGLGFIAGIGLQRGAIAGTVAHDHHNLITIGCDDESMRTACRAVIQTRGGLAAAEGGEVLAKLALPVAGLMSERPIDEVRAAYDALLAASERLGSRLHDPFMAMSFMALEVIPKLKLTDQGLVDVEAFKRVDLFVKD